MAPAPFPAACPHGPLEKIFDDVFFVSGGVRMSPPPMMFSRNMTVVRQGTSLTLVNTMRLDDAGLSALDELGRVEHVIRLAGFHGMDDPFYKDRYDATVWNVAGQTYASGFDAAKPAKAKPYFEADEQATEDTSLPIEGARLIRIASATPPEGVLLLDREGGILVTGDSLQNWARADAYFSFLAKLMMPLMGFIKAHNVGPGWVKGAKPDAADVRALADLPFDHVLPAHGGAVIGGARDKFRPAIDRVR